MTDYLSARCLARFTAGFFLLAVCGLTSAEPFSNRGVEHPANDPVPFHWTALCHPLDGLSTVVAISSGAGIEGNPLGVMGSTIAKFGTEIAADAQDERGSCIALRSTSRSLACGAAVNNFVIAAAGSAGGVAAGLGIMTALGVWRFAAQQQAAKECRYRLPEGWHGEFRFY